MSETLIAHRASTRKGFEANICPECKEFIGLPQHHKYSCSHWNFVPEPDSMKSEAQLHAEVFDPRLSDFDYFRLRKSHYEASPQIPASNENI